MQNATKRPPYEGITQQIGPELMQNAPKRHQITDRGGSPLDTHPLACVGFLSPPLWPSVKKNALLPLRNMAPRGCPQCAGEEPGLLRTPFLWRTIRDALGARGALGHFWKTPAVIYRGHPFGSLSLVTRDIPEEHSSMGAGLAATLAATLAARVVPSAVYGTPRGRLDL